ncbi:hypothetical protein IB305_004762 [Salmonella enterica]|nr:hypothetical protein [Salmonella enterica]
MKEKNKRYLAQITLALLMFANTAFCSLSTNVNTKNFEPYYKLPTLNIKEDEDTTTVLNDSLLDIGKQLSATQSVSKTIEELSETFINNSIADILNQKGTTRFGFRTNNGQVKYDFDFLYPAYYNDDLNSIIYTQFDAHQYERDILNAGVGYRAIFDGKYIFGGNVFLDYDIRNRNSRLGVGGEYSYKNSALSLNLYKGMTSWRQSKQKGMDDYDEKPANGYDVRINTRLPYGLDLTSVFEKYYGNNVSLQGNSDFQKSPSNFKAIARYTPIPLFSLLLEKGTKTEANIGAQLNYRFGVPFSEQLNGEIISSVYNTLPSRLVSFVDRNYNIAMNYRKQTVLTVTLPSHINGEYGDDVSITPTINSKYGVKEVKWTLSSIDKDGGKSSPGKNWSIKIQLPPQKEPQIKSYQVCIDVFDKKGHKQSAMTTIVAEPSNKKIKSHVINDNAAADGVDKNIVMFIVTNNVTKEKISNMRIHVSSHKATILNPELVSDANGEAKVEVQSQQSGLIPIRASLDNGISIEQVVHFTVDKSSLKIERLVTKNDSLSNDKDKNIISIFAKDKFGNPAGGIKLELNASNGAKPVTSLISTNETGHALAEFTSNTSGLSTASIYIDNIKYTEDLMSFIADKSTAKIANAVVTQNYAVAGLGNDRLKIIVTDANMNSLSKIPVTFSGDKALAFSQSTVITDDNGVSVVDISGKMPGCFGVTASIPNKTSLSLKLCFSINPEFAHLGNFTILNDSQIADGKHAVKFSVKVVDDKHQPVQQVRVKISSSNPLLQPQYTELTDKDGIISGTISSVQSGIFELWGGIVGAGHSEKEVNTKVTFVPDQSTASMTAITIKDGVPADAVSNNIVKVIVKDINDNPLAGYDIDFVGDSSSNFSNKKVTTDQMGSATNTVHSSVAGPHTLTAILALKPEVTAPINVTYSGDMKSAHVVSASETGAPTVANGKNINKVKLFVQDGNGNSVNNAIVKLYTDDPAISFVNDMVTTKSDGGAFVEVMSTRSAQHKFSAAVENALKNSYEVNVNFIGDPATVTIKNISVQKDNSIANGNDANIIKAIFVDSNENPVSNISVSMSLPSGFDTIEHGAQKTDENGTVSFSVVSHKKTGSFNFQLSYITTTATKTSLTPDVTFRYDLTSLQIKHNIIKDNSSTNNIETDIIEVTAFDKYGIPATGSVFNVTVNSDGLTYPQTINIPPSGVALLSISSQRAGYKTITTSMDDIKASSRIYFVADPKTGTLNAINIVKNHARVPNGDKIQAVVLDSHGDPVKNALVSFKSPTGVYSIPGTYSTDNDGKTQEINVYPRGVHGSYTIEANVVERKASEAKSAIVDFNIAGSFRSNGSTVKFTKQGNDVLADILVMRGDKLTPVEDSLMYSVHTVIWNKINDSTRESPSVRLKQGKVQILHKGVCDGSHSGDSLFFYATLSDKRNSWLNDSAAVKIDELCK